MKKKRVFLLMPSGEAPAGTSLIEVIKALAEDAGWNIRMLNCITILSGPTLYQRGRLKKRLDEDSLVSVIHKDETGEYISDSFEGSLVMDFKNSLTGKESAKEACSKALEIFRKAQEGAIYEKRLV